MVVFKNPSLLAFEKVVELKTVHAAASSLGITQAAVTKRIRALEGELGMTLFIRSRKGMAVTEEGKLLLQFCKATSEAEARLMGYLKGSNAADISLTLAGPTSAISSRIYKDVLPIYRKFPFLKLHLRSEDHANPVEMIRRGEVDFAVAHPYLVPNEMDSKVLKPDRYVLVATSKWHGRPLNEILGSERIIDFYESDRTTFNYLTKFGLEKEKRPDRFFVNENEALIRMFAEGVGYGTLTEDIAKPYLEGGQLTKLNRGQVYEDPLALVWYPRHEMPEYFRAVIRAIK